MGPISCATTMELRVSSVCARPVAAGLATANGYGVIEKKRRTFGWRGVAPMDALHRIIQLCLLDECLNTNSFWSLVQARVAISDWKHGYNHRRHSSLGYHPRPSTLPPVPTDERLSFVVDQFTGSGQPCYGIEGRIRK